jgi:accessory gene regulator protein AgrB
MWEKRDFQPSIDGSLLPEINELRLAIREFVKYVSRNYNNVAHVLAKQVTDTHQLEVWHVTPTYVYDFVRKESMSQKKKKTMLIDLILVVNLLRITSRTHDD